MPCCSVSCQDILEGSVHLQLFIPRDLTATSGLFCQSLVLVGGEKLSVAHKLFNPLVAKSQCRKDVNSSGEQSRNSL